VAWILTASGMALSLLVLALLIGYGGRRLRRGDAEQPPSGPWPPLALLVPVTGAPPGLSDCLRTLVEQDYPDYEVVFVTRDMADPAVATIQAVLHDAATAGRPPARHVVAGPAQGCGQKNYNHLAGLRSLSARPEILVFCDSTHLASPSWLRHLAAPLAAGLAFATTGSHHCHPLATNLPTLGKTISVLSLHLLQEIPLITQPWGGNMAIRRDCFETLGVAGVWAENVVDDVSLARCLDRARLKARPVSAACMETRLNQERWGGWSDWLTRQWMYLKCIYPGVWVGAGILLYALTGLVFCSLLWTAGGLLSLVGSAWSVSGAAYLTLLALLGHQARRLHPSPGPWPAWNAAFFITLGMAAWTYGRTLATMTIRWRAISYEVTWGGRVTAIRLPEGLRNQAQAGSPENHLPGAN